MHINRKCKLNDLPGTGEWTINPGSIAGTGTSYTIPDLTAETYNFTVTNADGCTSDTSAAVTIKPSRKHLHRLWLTQEHNLDVKRQQEVLNFHDLPATGEWTINPGGITGTGTSYTIPDLSAANIQFYSNQC